jgi:asparagine synthase (glutamine-hydrolysing)
MKQEFFIKDGELIPEHEWSSKINSFKINQKDELNEPENIIAAKLRKMVDQAIKERVEDVDNIGICFSGGLDSSYIAAVCKKLKVNFTCYTVGFQDGQFKEPEDIIYAKQVAKHLKLSEDEFKSRIFNLKEIEEIIKKTTEILKLANSCNVVTVGVGSVEVAAHSISKKERIFFSGLGSEELFAGYERHKLNPTNQECFDGLLKMHQRDLIRDTAVSKALNFSFTTPFLDDELIKYSMKIPVRYKINSTGSKMILRKAAEPYLGKHSLRPKKAAQYGSAIDRAMEKLARKNGFKRKDKYLESLK